MTKAKIATLLFTLKKTKQSYLMDKDGSLYTVDELLTQLLGRRVQIDEALTFLTPKTNA